MWEYLVDFIFSIAAKISSDSIRQSISVDILGQLTSVRRERRYHCNIHKLNECMRNASEPNFLIGIQENC